MGREENGIYLVLNLMEMQSFRDEYVAGGSPEPNVRAYTRISRTLLKITRALELTGKKLTIK